MGVDVDLYFVLSLCDDVNSELYKLRLMKYRRKITPAISGILPALEFIGDCWHLSETAGIYRRLQVFNEDCLRKNAYARECRRLLERIAVRDQIRNFCPDRNFG